MRGPTHTDTNMSHGNEHQTNGAGHETKEVSVPFVFASLTALLIGTFLAAMLAVGIFQFFKNTYHPDQAAKENIPVVPPAPRLQVHAPDELRDFRAREEHALSTYAIIDKQQGVVRIPIDRAIDLLAQKGLPTHNYLDDILAGRKSPAANQSQLAVPQAAQQKRLQGSINVQ